MSIIGMWEVAIATPMGSGVLDLEFADDHTGVARYGTDSFPLQNVVIIDDTATCNVSLTEPMRVTLKCSVVVDGDRMTGTARAGFFGTFALTGRRAG